MEGNTGPTGSTGPTGMNGGVTGTIETQLMTLTVATGGPFLFQSVTQVLSNAATSNTPYLLGVELTTPSNAPLGIQQLYRYYDSGTNEWKVSFKFRNFSIVNQSNVNWNIYYYNIS